MPSPHPSASPTLLVLPYFHFQIWQLADSSYQWTLPRIDSSRGELTAAVRSAQRRAPSSLTAPSSRLHISSAQKWFVVRLLHDFRRFGKPSSWGTTPQKQGSRAVVPLQILSLSPLITNIGCRLQKKDNTATHGQTISQLKQSQATIKDESHLESQFCVTLSHDFARLRKGLWVWQVLDIYFWHRLKTWRQC